MEVNRDVTYSRQYSIFAEPFNHAARQQRG